MLQGMLEKSRAESEKDRDLYAKFKCYCDEHEETTKKEDPFMAKQRRKSMNSVEANVPGRKASFKRVAWIKLWHEPGRWLLSQEIIIRKSSHFPIDRLQSDQQNVTESLAKTTDV